MERAPRVAINGFGRIGRALLRVLLTRAEVVPVAVNELAASDSMAYLLRYDSFHGKLPIQVDLDGDVLAVGDHRLKIFHEEDPQRLPWCDLGVDVVFECTGKFTGAGVRGHLAAGAKRVIVSAPSEAADLTVVVGVNHGKFDPAIHRVVSNGSCTTNCLAPIAMVLHRNFTIRKGLVTTIHSYTNDQKLLDSAHSDFRRGRSAAVSIVPTTTGAAGAVGLVLPELAGKLDGVSVRVPTPDVSLADITLLLGRDTTASEVNSVLREAAMGELSGVLGYSEEPLVSADYRGSPCSAVVDGPQTKLVEGDMVKITSWYDNEWGYANRLADLLAHLTMNS